MRHLLKLAVVLVVAFVVIGFWEHWFTLTRTPSSDGSADKVNVSVSIDKAKMRSDVQKAKENIKEDIKEFKDKAKSKNAAAKDAKPKEAK
jgi:hypothetical protein